MDGDIRYHSNSGVAKISQSSKRLSKNHIIVDFRQLVSCYEAELKIAGYNNLANGLFNFQLSKISGDFTISLNLENIIKNTIPYKYNKFVTPELAKQSILSKNYLKWSDISKQLTLQERERVKLITIIINKALEKVQRLIQKYDGIEIIGDRAALLKLINHEYTYLLYSKTIITWRYTFNDSNEVIF